MDSTYRPICREDIKLVLFDIGGVFIEYGDVFRTASREQDIPHELLDATFDKYDREITMGKITPQDLYESCLRENNLQADQNYDFMPNWVRDYTKIVPTYNLAKDLSLKYQIGLFSNIYKGIVPELIRQGFIPNIKFSYLFISCDIGMQKPDRDIYEFVLQKTGLLPKEILFVDDKEENLEPAYHMGWNTYHFDRQSPDRSTDDLKALLL